MSAERKYVWLASRDQRFNNWILYEESSETGVRLRERHRHLACDRCGKVDELAAVHEGADSETTIRSRHDYVTTNDGFVCVSARFQSFCGENGIDGLRFVPIPSHDRYAIALPTARAATDAGVAGMEFLRPCPACGRFRETCGLPVPASMSLPAGETTLVCPEIRLENTKGRVFWYLAPEELVSRLKAAKLSGIEYVPAG